MSETGNQQVEIDKELLELKKKEDRRGDKELDMARKEYQKRMELLELQISEKTSCLGINKIPKFVILKMCL